MSSPEDLATAHQAWDRVWQSEDGRRAWEQPDPLVRAIVPLLQGRGLRAALDLGCGIGRHAIFLAEQGLRVSAVDGSPAGIAQAAAAAQERSLDIDFRVAGFCPLDFPDGAFGCVIAWNTIYHGDGAAVQQILDEVRRVLAPGGIYAGTMLSRRNANFGRGREVAPSTFINEEAGGDKAHAHFYVDTRELLRLHHDFEIRLLEDREQKEPGSFHWQFILERG